MSETESVVDISINDSLDGACPSIGYNLCNRLVETAVVEDDKEVSSLTWSGKDSFVPGKKKPKTKKQLWEQHLALLVEYGESHSDFNVPDDFVVDCEGVSIHLGKWLAEQKSHVDGGLISQNHYFQLSQLMDTGRLWSCDVQCPVSVMYPSGCASSAILTRRKTDTAIQTSPGTALVANNPSSPSDMALHVVSPDPYSAALAEDAAPRHKRKHRGEQQQQQLDRVREIEEGSFLAFTYSEVDQPKVEDIRIGIGRVSKRRSAEVIDISRAAAAEISADVGSESTMGANGGDTGPRVVKLWLDNLMVTDAGTSAGCYLGLRLHDLYQEEVVNELIPLPVDSIVCGDLRFIRANRLTASSASEAEAASEHLFKLTQESREQLKRCRTAQEIHECRARVLNEFDI